MKYSRENKEEQRGYQDEKSRADINRELPGILPSASHEESRIPREILVVPAQTQFLFDLLPIHSILRDRMRCGRIAVQLLMSLLPARY